GPAISIRNCSTCASARSESTRGGRMATNPLSKDAHMQRLIALWLCFAPSLCLAECPEWPAERALAETRLLQHQLAEWDDAYHRRGVSLVDDEIYDQARQRVQLWQDCFEPTSSRADPLI